MKYKDILLTASSNLFRSKLRTILTILAIFIGAFTLTLTNGMGAGISSYVDKQVNNLGQKDVITITAKSTDASSTGSDEPQEYVEGQQTVASNMGPNSTAVLLTQNDVDTLKSNDDLTDVEASVSVTPDYIQGATDDKFKLSISALGTGTNLDLASGTQVSADSNQNQIIIPVSYVDSLGYSSADEAVGKTVTIAITDATGQQHTQTATIVGVQQKGLVGGSGAVINSTLKDSLYDVQSIGLPAASKDKYLSVTAKITGDLTDQHISDVKNSLSDAGYSGTTIDDQLGTFKTVINAITYVLNGFAVIALLAASFGIVNTLLMSVQERTKEIGLMKAMGMRSSRIFTLFSLEAVLIGFWGSALGVGIAMMAGAAINSIASNGLLKDLPGFDLLAFPAQSVVFIILLIMVIAFLAGALPARRAAKQNPIDALRYE